MSPELYKNINFVSIKNLDAEKSDVFSLGISFLCVVLLLKENDIIGINVEKNG